MANMPHESTSLAEVDGGPSTVPSSIWTTLENSIKEHPSNTAVVAMHQPSNHLSALVGSQTDKINTRHLAWSYEQMRLGALKTACFLSSKGVQRGSMLVTFIPNCAEWCLLLWTAALMELTLVPLDARLVKPARREDLIYYLETLKPAVVAVSDSEGAKVVELLASDVQLSLNIGICLEPAKSLGASWTTFGDISDQSLSSFQDGLLAPPPSDPDRIATIIFTSGTSSGLPKGCPHTVTSLLNSARCRASQKSLTANTRAIMHSANFRMIMNVLSLCLWQSDAMVIMPAASFSTGSTLDAIDEYQGTVMVAMPSMLHAIAKDSGYSTQRVRSLREIPVAGDVITLSILRTAQDLFPESDIVTQHGMTEGVGIFGWPVETDFSIPPPVYGEISSLGKVQPGSKICIIDDEKNIAKRGAIGELHIGGLSVVQRYLGEVKPELFYREGETHWLVTGDKGMVDEEGWVYIVGRSKDIIKKGGISIAPAALEASLNAYAGCPVCHSQSQILCLASLISL